MTSQTHSSVALQEFKPAFTFSLFVHTLVKLVRIGSAPIGNAAPFHYNAKKTGVPVAVKALKGCPVLCMPWRGVGEISIPFVFEQGQIAVTGNGVLIGALHKYLPIHLSTKFSTRLCPLVELVVFFQLFPARCKLNLRCLLKGFVGALVFGKLFRDLRVVGQIVPGPFGIVGVQNSRGVHAVHNVGGALTFKNNGALQMIDVGFGLSCTHNPQDGECHE
ncbi:hypothetical protein PsAD46_03470 [Pseudovibrio sp. Ad46]|nr:hypothetical protein PsAD46_03470 [Pseudovibrio sp. Ad46]